MRTTRHLGRRLLILYAITAVVVAAVFSTALLSSWLDTVTLLSVTTQRAHAYNALTTLQATERDSTLTLTNYLLSGDERTLADYQASLHARQDALDRLGAGSTRHETTESLALLRQQTAALDASAARVIATRRGGTASEALAQWQAESAPALAAISSQFTALGGQDTAPLAEITEVQRGHYVTLVLTFSFATVAALLGLWVTRRIILSVTQPLETLAVAAAAIGAGKLETRVAPGLSTEFDMLGGVMNTMAAHLATSRDDLRAALVEGERRNRELRLLSDIGTALNSALDLDLAIDRSLELVLPAFDIPVGAILLYDEAGEQWRWHEDNVGSAPRRELERAVRRALGTEALEAGQAVLLEPEAGSHVGALVIPLVAAVRTHGVLALALSAERQLTDRDCALLWQVGGQIARAIENVRLYIAEKGRSAEAGMLAQMAQLTSGTLDLDRLARLIARYAVQVLGVDRCIVGFFDPRGELSGRGVLQRLYQYGFRPQQAALVEGERESLQTIVRRHMLDGQTLVVPDAVGDARPEVRDLAGRLEARSFISVPLVARERRVGVIYLDTREPRQHGFGPQDQRILAAIADQAAAAIDGARLYEAERRRGAQLRVLNETSQQIAATAQLDELFRSVTTTIRESFGYGAARIGLIEGDELVFLRAADDDEQVGPERESLDGPGAAAWVVRHTTPRVTIIEEPERPEQARLIVPLRTKDRVIGVLEVASERRFPGGAFDADDERILLSLGDQLGVAVERSRLQERALSLAVVEERNRLARDLHDSVTQSLFSMNLMIEAARLLLRRDTEAAERQLINLGERTKDTLAEMRNLIYSLRPAELEEQGLPVALKRWGERVRHEHLLPVDVLVEGGARLRLGEMQERELFRIAQEALNNVVKHAGATRASVRLRATPAAIMLLIEDDGKGFDPAAAPRADAFGTRGMRERATLLGGEVAFDSTPGGGTRVLITVPRVAPSPPVALDNYRPQLPGARTGAAAATGGD